MKISVIIPVYNAATTVEMCVDSIIANDYKEIEVILIEDCSKDDSWAVCEKLSARHENVQCIRNERNRGVSYTRNQGLKRAIGEYTMFVDSDDWVDGNYFSEFLKIMQSAEQAMVVCGYVNHDEKVNGSTEEYRWDGFEGVKKHSTEDIIESLYKSTLLQQLWNKIFITRIIRDNQIWFDESINIGEDTRFVLDYIKAGQIHTIYLLNKPLYHYIRGKEGSLMYRVGYESVEEPLKNLRKLYEILDYEKERIDSLIEAERQRQIELYAYLIFHNSGMKQSEKKRLILQLDEVQGKKLYQKNKLLFYKERIAIALKKFMK